MNLHETHIPSEGIYYHKEDFGLLKKLGTVKSSNYLICFTMVLTELPTICNNFFIVVSDPEI